MRQDPAVCVRCDPISRDLQHPSATFQRSLVQRGRAFVNNVEWASRLDFIADLSLRIKGEWQLSR